MSNSDMQLRSKLTQELTEAYEHFDNLVERLRYIENESEEATQQAELAEERANRAKDQAQEAYDDCQVAKEYMDSLKNSLDQMQDLLSEGGNVGEKSLETDVRRYKEEVRKRAAAGHAVSKIAGDLDISEFLVQQCLKVETA